MNRPLYPLGTKDNFELIQWILDPKVIDGALRSAIHAHGPITLGNRVLYDSDGSVIRSCSTSSAAKRIRGAVRTRIVEYLKKNASLPRPTWYNRLLGLVRA